MRGEFSIRRVVECVVRKLWADALISNARWIARRTFQSSGSKDPVPKRDLARADVLNESVMIQDMPAIMAAGVRTSRTSRLVVVGERQISIREDARDNDQVMRLISAR